MKIKLTGTAVSTQEFVRRMFYLAWKASGVRGMGFFQDRGEQSEEEVWKNIVDSGDYFGHSRNQDDQPYADYVFGRMMKMGVVFNKDTIKFTNNKLALDYQSWGSRYKDYYHLAQAAASELGCGIELTT